ncbi:MAG: pyridoxamine 5'-phosphate oxidase family protein [Deltaproteobacteria bacterium]|nr:pyridoxamine 5'-phosphate oxidase family protein [Deltaproteobacteria bacterium]
MSDWSDLAAQRPDFAAAGARLFTQFGVAWLGTVAPDGPRLAPVCPVLSGAALYLIVARHTPKYRHLQHNPRYVLHACLGADDEEFQVRGTAHEVPAAAERSAVHQAATFSFQADDPIFRLAVVHSLWCHWENVGQPGTRAIRQRWSAV